MFPLFVRIAEAQDNGVATATVDTFIAKVNDVIINPLISVLFVIAFMLFLFGMLRFFFQRDQSSDAAKQGRQHMLWGIVGMFIMLSVFAIMAMIKNTLGV